MIGTLADVNVGLNSTKPNPNGGLGCDVVAVGALKCWELSYTKGIIGGGWKRGINPIVPSP